MITDYLMMAAAVVIAVYLTMKFFAVPRNKKKYYVVYSFRGSEVCLYNNRRGLMTLAEARSTRAGLKEEGFHVLIAKVAE